VSALAPNVQIALALTGPLLTPFMIFGGFFLNNDSIPVYFIWIKYISWLNYANEIILLNQWDGVTNITCGSNSASCFKTGEEVLKFSGVKEVLLCFIAYFIYKLRK
jgi:hypothetical protein